MHPNIPVKNPHHFKLNTSSRDVFSTFNLLNVPIFIFGIIPYPFSLLLVNNLYSATLYPLIFQRPILTSFISAIIELLLLHWTAPNPYPEDTKRLPSFFGLND